MKLADTKINFLNIFRFIAALLVLRQHVNFARPDINLFGQDLGWLLTGSNSSGFNAILFFLILSSFIISKNYFEGYYKTDLKGIYNFYLKRFARIYPLYFFIVTISLLLNFRFYLNLENIKFLRDVYLMNYYFQRPFNQVIWILSVEVLFYLFIPIISFLITRIFDLKKKFLPQILGIILALGSLHLIYEPIALNDPFIYFFNVQNFVNFWGELGLGLSMALILHKQKIKDGSIAKVIALGLILLAWMNLAFPLNNQWLDRQDTRLLLALTIAICIGLFDLLQRGGFSLKLSYKSKKIYQFLFLGGTLSYAFYLSHMIFLLRFDRWFLLDLQSTFGDFYGKIVQFSIVTIASFVFSWIIYKYIEKPAHKLIIAKFSKK